ncbi:MAG: hypothetical protein KF766_07650 [Rhodocyclaceae bacterium]|nr:hypothetical protein [Rhodocyclaceae bacterium]
MADNTKAAHKVFNHPVAWLPPLLGAMLVYLAPPAIADHVSIQMLARFSASFSGIYEQANRSLFPSQALIFYAITYSAFPFQLAYLGRRWIKFLDKDVTVAFFRRLSYPKRIALMLVSLIGLAAFYWAVFFLTEDPSFCKGCTTDSLVGLIMFQTGGLFGVAIAAFSNLRFIQIIPSVFFSKSQ